MHISEKVQNHSVKSTSNHWYTPTASICDALLEVLPSPHKDDVVNSTHLLESWMELEKKQSLENKLLKFTKLMDTKTTPWHAKEIEATSNMDGEDGIVHRTKV